MGDVRKMDYIWRQKLQPSPESNQSRLVQNKDTGDKCLEIRVIDGLEVIIESLVSLEGTIKVKYVKE